MSSSLHDFARCSVAMSVWLWSGAFTIVGSLSCWISRMGFDYLIKHPYVLCRGVCPLSQFQLVSIFTALSELAVFCSMGVEKIKVAMWPKFCHLTTQSSWFSSCLSAASENLLSPCSKCFLCPFFGDLYVHVLCINHLRVAV